jgi:ketosteroid isomerase-like protein
VSIESMVVDDVTVILMGDTAIVRGRTQATGVVGGQRGSARLRFTDTFIKRSGQWQAVASHVTTLVR